MLPHNKSLRKSRRRIEEKKAFSFIPPCFCGGFCALFRLQWRRRQTLEGSGAGVTGTDLGQESQQYTGGDG